jgi:hypothetical protein
LGSRTAAIFAQIHGIFDFQRIGLGKFDETAKFRVKITCHGLQLFITRPPYRKIAMHRLPHEEYLLRYRMAAALLLFKWLMIPVSFAFLLYSLVVGERALVFLALGLIGLTVMLFVSQWLLASRCRCPLCLGQPLARKACSKNRNATRLFGSYRLRVAHSIMWQGCFRCPYCGEPTVMEVRHHHRGRGYRH